VPTDRLAVPAARRSCAARQAWTLAIGLFLAPRLVVAQTVSPVEDQRWAFSATLGRFQTDNFFLISPDAPGDSVDTVSVGLLYGHSGARLAYSGYGRASLNYFERFNQHNRINYGGGAGLTYQISPTARISASQVASSGFYAPLLLELGVFVPQVRVNAFRSAVAATWQPGPRTTFTADGSFLHLDYSSDLSTLDPALIPHDALALAGALPPEQAAIDLEGLATPLDASLVVLSALSAEGVRQNQLELTTFRAGLQVEQALTQRLSGTAQVGYRGLDYSTAGLASGGQLDSGASLRLALGTGTDTTLRYTYEQNRAQVPAVTNQTVLLEVEHDLTPRVKVEASVGLGASDQVGVVEPSGTSWLGGVGVSGRLRRTHYDLHYGRTLFQAYGFGRNYLTDYGSGFIEHRFAKRLTGRVDLYYRRSEDIFARSFFFVSQAYRASASYRVQRRTLIGGFYSYRIVDQGSGVPVIMSPAWGFSVTYAKAFK